MNIVFIHIYEFVDKREFVRTESDCIFSELR